MPASTLRLQIDGLPSTVSLRPGKLEIEFFGAEDLFRQLFEIAQVIQNDYQRFSKLVEG